MSLGDDELRVRAEQELELLLLRLGTTPPSDQTRVLSECRTALTAFVNVGILSPDSEERWRNQFTATTAFLSPGHTEHLPTTARVLPPVTADRSEIHQTPGARKDPRHPSAVLDSTPPVLTLAIDSPTATTVRIRGIEIYDHFVAVLMTQLDLAVPSAAIVLGTELQDDRHTAYARLGTEVPKRSRWEQLFTPGVPTDASVLRVGIGTEQFTIALPSAWSRRNASPSTS